MNAFFLDLLRGSVSNSYRVFQAAARGGWAPPPLFFHLLLTYRCNLHCPFCFLHMHPGAVPSVQLSQDWVGRFLDRIPRWSTVSFSGGEPFCHPEVFPILERASRSHRVALVTNGSLLREEGCNRLVGMAPARFGKPGVTSVGLSLYESPGEAGFEAGFEKERTLLERIRAAKIAAHRHLPLVELKVVIRPRNVACLDRYLLFLRSNLADVVSFQVQTRVDYPIYYDGRESDQDTGGLLQPADDLQGGEFPDRDTAARQLDIVLASPERKRRQVRFYPETSREELLRCITGEPMVERYGCVFPWMGMGISPFGNAFLCRTRLSEDVTEQPVLRAWNSPHFRSFRREVLGANLGERCPGCCFLMRRRFR